MIDTASVGKLVSPFAIALSALPNFSRVVPLPSLTPNSPPNWPSATWMPTPVRKPMRTLCDRKLAMNPSRMSRATIMNTPHIRAASPAIATHCGEPGCAGGGDPGQAGRHDRGGRRVRADHEVARRAEERERRIGRTSV